MRHAKNWGLMSLTLALLSCSLFSAVFDSAPPSEGQTASPASTSPVPPALNPLAKDKWALWTNGTQLRGANTWQRIVVPEYDGEAFLGDGHVGPPYTQEDFNRLAALGANYVNLSHPGLYTERPPYILDESVQANLDGLIAMAAQADLFVVITFRTGPGRNDFTFYRDDDWFAPEDLIENVWSDPAARQAWVEMWRYTAGRYRDDPAVVGYDLMCEPNANEILNEWDREDFYETYGGSGYDWNAWYPEIVAAIREVDEDTPILIGGNGYSALDWLPDLQPVDAEHIVFTFHQYAPSMYSFQEPGGAKTYPGRFDTDYDGQSDLFDRAWLEGYLSIAGDYAGEHGAALAVNEFGAARWVTGVEDFIHDEMALFEQYGMNYALWVWDPEWQPWNEGVNTFNFRYGTDPENTSDVENGLLSIITDFWGRNTVRPSNFNEGTN